VSELLRCQSCGGAVVWNAAQVEAACLFCATVALELELDADPLPEPEVHLPVRVSRAQAEEHFRAWATSSWFRPRELRTAPVELHLMRLPAWRFRSRLETHWAGLRRAATRSGKDPVSGVEFAELSHMVPASAGLSQAELSALQPFDEDDAEPWTGAAELEELIWEPPALSQRGARAQAHRELAEEHRRRIARTHGLIRSRVSAVIEDHDLRLMLVPIYIGSFRFRDRPWRFLINAQTGAVVGDAPIDRRKAFALVLVAALVGAALVWLTQRPEAVLSLFRPLVSALSDAL
jgi:hypothetical protein